MTAPSEPTITAPGSGTPFSSSAAAWWAWRCRLKITQAQTLIPITSSRTSITTLAPGRPDPAGDLYDAEVRKLKRKWVGEQLQLLQQRRLVHRVDRPGRRPHLVVLRDDGAGKLFDDPDGTTGNTYVTVLGAIIASGELVKWGTAELATYLAAMVAEWHDPTFDSDKVPAGSGRWYRPVSWFNSDRRPAHHVRIPFSAATLERGLKRLIAEGLIAKDQRLQDPTTGRRFRTGRRNVYTNRFAILNEVVQAQTIGSEQFDAEMRQLVEASPAAPGRDT